MAYAQYTYVAHLMSLKSVLLLTLNTCFKLDKFVPFILDKSVVFCHTSVLEHSYHKFKTACHIPCKKLNINIHLSLSPTDQHISLSAD